MNTSRKGTEYERAFKKHLLYVHRAHAVMRAAASKGLFDLCAIEDDAVCFYQCKSSKMTCAAALALKRDLVRHVGDWPHFLPYVVHPGKERQFCEH